MIYNFVHYDLKFKFVLKNNYLSEQRILQYSARLEFSMTVAAAFAKTAIVRFS